jgi:hypothetical protein
MRLGGVKDSLAHFAPFAPIATFTASGLFYCLEVFLKLTKAEIKAHQEAVKILTKDRLSWDDKMFVLENWHEGAEHINSYAGAFFTPPMLARDLMIEVNRCSRSIVDLCAGIGVLALFAGQNTDARITCVEINPAYVEIGKKIVPEAEWICASIFDFSPDGHFDCAISNPPFGAIKSGKADNDGLGGFEFSTIFKASKIAREGAFILPQTSTPFKYSGNTHYEDLRGTDRLSRKVASFCEKTGIEYDFNCGIDTSIYLNQWRGVSPVCEICTFEFTDKDEEETQQGQLDLF